MTESSLKHDTPIIGVFFNRTPDSSGYFYERKQFRDYLPELVEVFDKSGMQLVILCEESSYLGMGLFASYWLPSAQTKGTFKQQTAIIKPDLIYDKGHFGSNDGQVKVINSIVLSKIGRNKYTQSVLFADWQPSSALLLPSMAGTEPIGQIKTELVVVKPLHLNGGRGVEVIPLTEVANKSYDEPVLLQEFIETSGGIPGIVDTRHDLRLYILNGHVKLASVRTPKKGSYISNTGQGGSIAFIDVNLVPDKPRQIAQKVDDILQVYGNRYYSVDLVFDGQKWWLIEMNDRPGIPARFQGGFASEFHETFATFFKKALK